IKMKVVMVGTPYLYALLQYYDPEFLKMFKIKADFDSDMPRNLETEQQMAQFICSFVRREGKIPFTVDAVAEVIEWASRLADHQDRITTEFNKIIEIIVESTAWAVAENAKLVEAKHVHKAIEEKRFRSNLIQERIQRAFEEGVIHIQTEGAAVGQINGLSVIDLRDYAFGHPSRITANVYMGQEGVVNIEREVKLTGPIHNKGLLILTSYLGRKYAQNMPLSLSARIAFEQTYSEIEGDSASSTELYCLLSALANVPLRQEIAVTGSVDQFGNVQPIGGANEKIEGFFRYCNSKGLSGRQGVMIPKRNVIHLMLSQEVLDAVSEGNFHIWAVDTIDQGIEILTGKPAGAPDEQGVYPEDSIHGLVKKQLVSWMKEAARLKKEFGIDGEKESEKTEE
ncbi:MAG TPA: ATP-dependent protease, partial [Aminobacterium sp.]|nr:ATP-dependent protease [Aminobacterium sp.]